MTTHLTLPIMASNDFTYHKENMKLDRFADLGDKNISVSAFWGVKTFHLPQAKFQSDEEIRTNTEPV